MPVWGQHLRIGTPARAVRPKPCLHAQAPPLQPFIMQAAWAARWAAERVGTQCGQAASPPHTGERSATTARTCSQSSMRSEGRGVVWCVGWGWGGGTKGGWGLCWQEGGWRNPYAEARDGSPGCGADPHSTQLAPALGRSALAPCSTACGPASPEASPVSGAVRPTLLTPFLARSLLPSRFEHLALEYDEDDIGDLEEQGETIRGFADVKGGPKRAAQPHPLCPSFCLKQGAWPRMHVKPELIQLPHECAAKSCQML